MVTYKVWSIRTVIMWTCTVNNWIELQYLFMVENYLLIIKWLYINIIEIWMEGVPILQYGNFGYCMQCFFQIHHTHSSINFRFQILILWPTFYSSIVSLEVQIITYRKSLIFLSKDHPSQVDMLLSDKKMA